MEKVSLSKYNFSKLLIATMVGIMTVVIIAQVICRTFLGFSIFWSEELARYLLVWITFVGASMAMRNADLAALDIIQNKINGKWQWFYQLIIELFVLIFVIVAFCYGIKQSFSPGVMIQVSPALRLPMSFAYISVPVGFGFMLIHSIRSLVKVIASRKGKAQCQLP